METLLFHRLGLPVLLAVLLAPCLLAAAEDGPENVRDGVIFRFSSPDAKSVSVAGEFNGWDMNASPMTFDEGENLFWVKLELDEGEYAYKYVINGTTWVKDEHAHKFVDDGFGGQNSVVVVKRPGGVEEAESGEAEEVPEVTQCGAGYATFRYRSASAATVAVAGGFNGFNPNRDFLKDEDGDNVWELKMFLPPGEYSYFFVIDGREWRKDMNATDFRDDSFGGQNSAVIIE